LIIVIIEEKQKYFGKQKDKEHLKIFSQKRSQCLKMITLLNKIFVKTIKIIIQLKELEIIVFQNFKSIQSKVTLNSYRNLNSIFSKRNNL
jgi:Cu2+-containing amine oxidase